MKHLMSCAMHLATFVAIHVVITFITVFLVVAIVIKNTLIILDCNYASVLLATRSTLVDLSFLS